MDIIKTLNYEMLQLKENQINQVSSEVSIQSALKQNNCLGFYAYENQIKIGFALLREFKKRQFFLWNFIIDQRYQSSGKGKEFLNLLINILKENYSAELITTTYIYGNKIAKKLYESLGFVQTEICYEDSIHEVNMKLIL